MPQPKDSAPKDRGGDPEISFNLSNSFMLTSPTRSPKFSLQVPVQLSLLSWSSHMLPVTSFHSKQIGNHLGFQNLMVSSITPFSCHSRTTIIHGHAGIQGGQHSGEWALPSSNKWYFLNGAALCSVETHMRLNS